MPDYSVVVPVFNSEQTLEELLGFIKSFFDARQLSFEVICIDDCSTDSSWDVLESLTKCYPTLTAIRLSVNTGQHHATSCGIKHSKGAFIVTIDDDMQVHPEEIGKLIEVQIQTSSDVVYGIYPQKKHSVWRNWGSKMFGFIFKRYAKTISKGSSFKLIRAGIAQKVASHNIRYMYIDEIINWYTNRITTVEVTHHPRRQGSSGYTFAGLVFLSINYIINYTTLPLRLMTYLGFFFSLISFIIGLYFVYRKVFFGAEIGFTALITAIFFSTGILLFCFGIIGEYIRRLFGVSYNKPAYTIQHIVGASTES